MEGTEGANVAPKIQTPMTRAEIYFEIKKKVQEFIAERTAQNPEAGEYFAKSIVFSDAALTVNFKKVPMPSKKG